MQVEDIDFNDVSSGKASLYKQEEQEEVFEVFSSSDSWAKIKAQQEELND